MFENQFKKHKSVKVYPYEIKYTIADMAGEADQQTWSCWALDANTALAKFWEAKVVPEDTTAVAIKAIDLQEEKELNIMAKFIVPAYDTCN